MRFIAILKTVLQIGSAAVPGIINAFAPGMGTLIGTILQAALTAEAQLGGGGTGKEKFTHALELVQISAPAIVQLIESQTGRQLADEELFARGIGEMQQGAVDVLNAFGALPKKAA